MISGAHSIVYSTEADADRGFFRDVLELPSVDVGGGWLVFGQPRHPRPKPMTRKARRD